MWSSVTARLRNSHSTYLHTPGVTTRKPLPAVIQIRVVSCPGTHFSIYLTHGTGVAQHRTDVGAFRRPLLPRLLLQLSKHMSPYSEYLFLQIMDPAHASSAQHFLL